MIYPQVKPIGLIKQEISRFSKHLFYITLSSTIIIPIAYIPLFLNYYAFVIFIIPVALIASGIGFYRMYCVYRLGTTLEDLGSYYMQETPSSKKAGEMLKISLIVSLVFGTIGYILLAYAYYKIAETFKELYNHGIYPRRETRLLFYSVVGSAFSATLFTLSIFIFIFSWSYVGPIIFVSLSGVAVLASFIVEVVGYHKLSNDVIDILERPPSTIAYQPYPVAPLGTVYHQPVSTQPVYVQHPQQPVYTQPFQPSQPQVSTSKPIAKPPIEESEILFCPECGAQIAGATSFCPKCGVKLD